MIRTFWSDCLSTPNNVWIQVCKLIKPCCYCMHVSNNSGHNKGFMKNQDLLASGALKGTKTPLFLFFFFLLALAMAGGEEGQPGSWEHSQSTYIASATMDCQIISATKSFTAAETFAHLFKSGLTLLSYTHSGYVFCLSAYNSGKRTGKG